MLTPHRRALFEASYSALLLRADRIGPPAATPAAPADQSSVKPGSSLQGPKEGAPGTRPGR